MTRYFSVDVETTSTNPATGQLLSIGAVEIDSNEKFHAVVEDITDETLLWDMTPVTGTHAWWHSEPLEAAFKRHASFPIEEGFSGADRFHSWVTGFKEDQRDSCIFVAWPASFDYPYMQSWLASCGAENPFHYRTIDLHSALSAVLKVPFDAPRTAFPQWTELHPEFEHDALSDAEAQAEVFRHLLNYMKS